MCPAGFVVHPEARATMHKVFIGHHHRNDQYYKNQLVDFGSRHSVFWDRSVDAGDIPDEWTDQQIRREIRDKYLRDSTVTIVLVGRETRRRKHGDWEIHSSMCDGSVNRRSGVVVINLPRDIRRSMPGGIRRRGKEAAVSRDSIVGQRRE